MFSRLYKGLAKKDGLEIYRTDKLGKPTSEFTREFGLWCFKLNDITREGFEAGVSNLEKQIIKNSSEGVKSYPLSYAEFKGLCIEPTPKACHKLHIGLPAPKMSKAERSEKMRSVLDSVGSLKYKGEEQ